MIFTEPYTEIIGGKDLFIDQHSSINLTCTVHSPEPPAHIFWMKNGKVSKNSYWIRNRFFTNNNIMCISAIDKNSDISS